jgi:hypothetical protein
MPVAIGNFEVVQETPAQSAPAAAPLSANAELDVAALERELAVLRARALRVRAY